MRFDALPPQLAPADAVRFQFVAELVAWRRLDSLVTAEKLRGQHIWRDEVIAERVDWGREQAIFALAVRVRQLAQPVELPLLPAYGGCKSWVELAEDVPVSGATPVLSEAAFADKLTAFQTALGGTA